MQTDDSSTRMPSFLTRQFDDCWRRQQTLESQHAKLYRSRCSTFYFCIALLIAWFIGQPFADPAALHFVVQTVGLVLVALGLGMLRVLQYFLPVVTMLDAAKNELLKIKGELGVDFEANRGNPVEIAKTLTSEKQSEYQSRLDRVSENLSQAKITLQKSLFDAYTELFGVLQTRVSARPENQESSDPGRPRT